MTQIQFYCKWYKNKKEYNVKKDKNIRFLKNILCTLLKASFLSQFTTIISQVHSSFDVGSPQLY